MTIPRMTLRINGLTTGDSAIAVAPRGFKGAEAISRSFEFRVWFSTTSAVTKSTAESIMGNKAVFTAKDRDDNKLKVKGRVFEIGDGDTWSTGVYYYYVVIRPEFDLLRYNRRTRSFANSSQFAIEDFLKTDCGLFNDSGSEIATDGSPQKLLASFALVASHVPFDFVMQYQESDHNFVNRLCERYGIAYTFDSDDGAIYFFDSKNSYASSVVTLQVKNTQYGSFDSNQCLYSFRMQYKPGPLVFTAKDYRWEQSTSSDKGVQESTADGTTNVRSAGYGTFIGYGANYHEVTDSTNDKRFGEVLRERAECRMLMFKGGSNSLDLRPGNIFTVDHETNADMDGDYVIVDVEHVCNLANGKTRFADENEMRNSNIDASATSLDYYNEFYAVPADQFYVAPKAAGEPRISGVIPGKIASSTDTIPGVTSDGRYKVQLLLDESVTSDGTASTLVIRISQPFGGPAASGNATGCHFPLQDDTEVLVGFVEGDPDRPVIIGTVANASNASVAETASSQVHRIRTASSALFEISDA